MLKNTMPSNAGAQQCHVKPLKVWLVDAFGSITRNISAVEYVLDVPFLLLSAHFRGLGAKPCQVKNPTGAQAPKLRLDFGPTLDIQGITSFRSLLANLPATDHCFIGATAKERIQHPTHKNPPEILAPNPTSPRHKHGSVDGSCCNSAAPRTTPECSVGLATIIIVIIILLGTIIIIIITIILIILFGVSL